MFRIMISQALAFAGFQTFTAGDMDLIEPNHFLVGREIKAEYFTRCRAQFRQDSWTVRPHCGNGCKATLHQEHC
jgi:hypothetical protein